jgi:hypothetical protein
MLFSFGLQKAMRAKKRIMAANSSDPWQLVNEFPDFLTILFVPERS